MTPGLSFFYGGMVGKRNVISTMLQSFIALGVISILWVVVGFSLSFGESIGFTINGEHYGIIGNPLSYPFFNHVGAFPHKDMASTIPFVLFALFQMKFAVITPALVTGSFAERVRFISYLLFMILFSLIIYTPLCHMVWHPEGLLNKYFGVKDFAGGTVVHMNGGLAGLVLAILIGKRAGYSKVAMKPASIILTAVGAGLLWFGWYGFNAGSAFGANAIAGVAFLTTTVAAAVATITWILVESLVFKKPTLLGAASGAVAGLVAITPAAGFVSVGGALIIGIVGAIVAFFGVSILKKKLGFDDSLDAFGVHFLAGLWGAIATGIFALNDKALLWSGPLKDADDRMGQIMVQLESCLIVGVYTLIGTVVVYYIASILTGGARVNEDNESQGLDESVHGERGFNL